MDKYYFLCLGDLPRCDAEIRELEKITGGDAAIVVENGYDVHTPIEKIVELINKGLYAGVILAANRFDLVEPFARHTEILTLVPEFAHAVSAGIADVEVSTPCGARYMNFLKFVVPTGISSNGYEINYEDAPHKVEGLS